MNIFSVGFSCGDDFDGKESKVAAYVNESRDHTKQSVGMEMHHDDDDDEDVEVDFEIWPVEHPMEPPDEDRPVKCPMPADSSVINEGGKRERRFGESMRKRAEVSEEMKKEGMEEVVAERPIKTVRKRHHTLTLGGGDHIIMPLSRMPPLPSLPTQSITIFQMLQQFDKFES